MSDFPIEVVIIAGCAFSFILGPMLWDAHLNKQEERKEKREQQYELAMDKAREKHIALKSIVDKLESNRRCVNRTLLSVVDIKGELRVYEMEVQGKSISEKNVYNDTRLKRLTANMDYLCRNLGQLEESLEDLKCQLCRYECGMK